jgi:hypothetical protein
MYRFQVPLSVTLQGLLIYNSSASNRAIAVIDFGSTKSVSAGTLTISLPSASASTALIRIS